MIRVVVVEDSPVVQDFMTYLLESDPDLLVVGKAGDGRQALDVVRKKRPDVITMDIHMPGLDGFEATRGIMENLPTPIVIVTGSSSTREVTTAFRALEAGALAVVDRPPGIGHADHQARSAHLIRTVKLMSEVKVVRRWPQARRIESAQASVPVRKEVRRGRSKIEVIAVGASTGGPLAVQTLLSALPPEFSIPVVIVQHMSSGFTRGFGEWLSQTCGRPVHMAKDGERMLPGHIYLAPEGSQMKVRSRGILGLSQDGTQESHQPSVASLFYSVGEVYGASAVGILLTGMGKDGAEELKRMRETGAITIAQSEESSVVHGMPGEAIRLDAAAHVLSPVQIGELLGRLIKENVGPAEGGPRPEGGGETDP